jgi:hypothetical protein
MGLFKGNYAVLIISILFILPLLPVIILGKDSYIVIHDVLDDAFPRIVNFLNSGKLITWEANNYHNVMKDLPRTASSTGLKVTPIIYYFISDPFWALFTNRFIVHIIGFFGMFLFLKRYIFKNNRNNKFIVLFIALLFGVVPYYTIYGISVAGVPLFIYSAFNFIYFKPRWSDYLILSLFPFYSGLALIGVFLLFSLFLLYIYEILIKHRMLNRIIFLGVSIAILYIIAESPILYQTFFNSDFVSHRVEFDRNYFIMTIGIKDILSDFFNLLLGLRYPFGPMFNHTGGFITIPIITMIILIISIKASHYKIFQPITFILLIVYLIFIITLITFYPLIERYLGSKIPIISFAAFNRFYFLLPALWIFLLAISIEYIARKKSLRVFTWTVLIVTYVIIIFTDYGFPKNIKLLAGGTIGEPTFKQFYAKDLFDEVKQTIKEPIDDFFVVSIGMYPVIAQYNGFRTLDSYQPNYQLEYKHNFRKVIESELEKNIFLKEVYDNWGTRCYVFVDELGHDFLYGKKKNGIIHNLELNTTHLKEMGGKYVISAVLIENSSDNKLKLINVFENKDSFWKIYLYKITA